MKKLLLLLTVLFALTSLNAQVNRGSSVEGSDDSSMNRTIKNTVNKRLGGGMTADVVLSTTRGGNDVTVVSVAKNNKPQSLLVIMTRDSVVLVERSYSLKKYREPADAADATYNDYYNPYQRRGRGLLNQAINLATGNATGIIDMSGRNRSW